MCIRDRTSAEEFFLKSINVESIFEFVERTDYLFLYSIKECVEKSDCHEGNIAKRLDVYRINKRKPEVKFFRPTGLFII